MQKTETKTKSKKNKLKIKKPSDAVVAGKNNMEEGEGMTHILNQSKCEDARTSVVCHA